MGYLEEIKEAATEEMLETLERLDEILDKYEVDAELREAIKELILDKGEEIVQENQFKSDYNDNLEELYKEYDELRKKLNKIAELAKID